MKRITNLLLVALAVLGLASCQKGANSDLPNNGENEGNTYVGLNILFPRAGGLKAAEDYNKIAGEWKGRDVIKQIDVYLVSSTSTTVVASSFTADSFFGIDNNGILSPKMAVKANADEKVKAYVVINDVNKKITGQLNGVSAAEFDDKFKQVVKVTDLNDLSSYDGGKEIIVMTNSVDPVEKTIEANVTEEQAKNGVANRIDVEVLRLTSRAIVTVKKDIAKEVTVKNKLVNNAGQEKEIKTAKVTISEISYATEGGALQVNPIQPTDFKAATAVYDFIPKAKPWEEVKTSADRIFTFDGKLKEIPTTSYIDTANAENLKPALEGEEFAMSLLPVTHEEGKYRKGNTPFFTIAAKFKAENIVSEVEIGGVKYQAEKTLKADAGTTVYLGVKTGLFYSTLQKAQSMDPDNAENGELTADQIKQEVKEFKDGKMYYNVWINPNVPYTEGEKITMSPVYRNQVYNAHITGFKEIGMTNTYDKPFKPEDPLETENTYLSVQLKVLPYTIHSYTVDLSNRY